MFNGLTIAECVDAFNVIDPAIRSAMERGIVKRPAGCLVVLNPAIHWSSEYEPTLNLENEPVLFSTFFGELKDWEHPYIEIALSKAFISWKTGLPSRQVQLEAPYLYEEGMTKYGGSAVGEGGLVVAFSGVEEYFDQMISEMMRDAIKGVCLHEMHKRNGVMANNVIEFIGQE